MRSGRFTFVELLAGFLGVILYSMAVRPTPVLHAVVVFLVCQVVARGLLIQRRR
jgi:hypothetical protein